jgi:hypothetical protein
MPKKTYSAIEVDAFRQRLQREHADELRQAIDDAWKRGHADGMLAHVNEMRRSLFLPLLDALETK